MELNHTIVPARDKVASAQFFADIFGLAYEGPAGHFAPVQVDAALTLDFDGATSFESHHYAFKVSDEEFDATLARLTERQVVYGSGPRSAKDGKLNSRRGGRGLYFEDPNGHLYEILTRD